MEIYKKMYAITCGAMSDALDKLPWSPENVDARLIIEKGLLDAEELYLQVTDENDKPT